MTDIRNGAEKRGRGFQKGHAPTKGSFQKGGDPRRNDKGQRNKEAVAFSRTLRAILVEIGEEIKEVRDDQNRLVGRKKNVEWLARVIWREALKGKEVFVSFIADRVEGKITQPFDHSGDISVDGELTIRVIETKD